VTETAKTLPIIRITRWTAKRSGPRMTVTGHKVTTGDVIKVSVDEISAGTSAVLATDRKTGQTYGLRA